MFVKLKWLLSQSRPVIFHLFVIIVLGSIVSIVNVYRALVSKSLIDSATLGKKELITKWIVIFGVIICIEILLRVEEAEYVNNSVMSPKKDEANTLNNLGKQHLDGEQALAYARIRTVGNGSYERTERHRKVISLIIDKLKNETSILKMPSVLTKLMSYVKTNMNLAELLEYSYAGYKIYDHNVQQLQIPTDKLSYGGIYKNKGWVLLIDKKQNIKAMHNFIFDDIEYHESEYEAFSIDK